MKPPDVVQRFLSWLAEAPAGTLVPVDHVRAQLRPLTVPAAGGAPRAVDGASWRERLWTAPAETRIGVHELAAAMGRSPSWVWRRCGAGAGVQALPHRKVDGELVFTVGDIREWVKRRETPAAERLRRVK